MKLSVPEAASLLAASDDKVYDWIEDASLPARKIRGRYHINPTELLEWATEHGIVVAPRAFKRPSDAPGVPSIADALRCRSPAMASPSRACACRRCCRRASQC